MQDTIVNLEWEIWKDIPGYEGIYRICNIGNKVESYWTKMRWRILKPIENYWYLHVDLCKHWKIRRCRIHRLKAITFMKNPFNLPQINHKDWNKKNNELSNLEWVSGKENIIHAFKNGFMKNNYFTKMNPNRWKFWKQSPVAKPVIQYSMSWEFIKKFDSISDAEREVWAMHITSVCKWRYESSWWYKWKYMKDTDLTQFLEDCQEDLLIIHS